MGVLDTLKGLVGGHKEQAKEGVEKAGKIADEKTGGSHSSQISAAEKKADEEIDNLHDGSSNT